MSLTNLTLDLAIGFNGLAKQYGSDCTVWLTKTQPVLKWNTASSTSIHAEYAQADLDSTANVKCLCEMCEYCVVSTVKKAGAPVRRYRRYPQSVFLSSPTAPMHIVQGVVLNASWPEHQCAYECTKYSLQTLV